MPVIRCPKPADVHRAVDALVRDQRSALFVFFGSEDPGSGASWCPDCVAADPVLRRVCLQQRPDLTFHECPVGERVDWKNRPDHPYRLHPALRLARIPTLIFIERGVERGRLVEADCADAATVAAFIAADAAVAVPPLAG